jgi:hypothetical protein
MENKNIMEIYNRLSTEGKAHIKQAAIWALQQEQKAITLNNTLRRIQDTQVPAQQVPAQRVPAQQASAQQVPAQQASAQRVPAHRVPKKQVWANQTPETLKNEQLYVVGYDIYKKLYVGFSDMSKASDYAGVQKQSIKNKVTGKSLGKHNNRNTGRNTTDYPIITWIWLKGASSNDLINKVFNIDPSQIVFNPVHKFNNT